MRLNRLDLIRYGRFDDARVSFPRPADGMPDVTVVFGRNEAGKSTAFNGFLELLFGFKGGTHPYAFRFQRSDLVVGAELDLPGRGTMAFRRNSKRTESLLDANDRPISEAILSGALHGLARDAYEERFSLNEKGLREGGERIAGAQGDLGQLLHAGLSGLTGMAKALESLADRADKFHKSRGRGTVLKTGRDRLKKIARDLRSDRLTPERERELRRDRDRALADFEKADADLVQARQRRAASAAAGVWHEKGGTIARLTRELADSPAGPDLPPGAAERVAGLVEKIDGLETRIAEKEDGIAAQDRIIAEHPADELAPPLATEMKRLDETIVDGAPLIDRASTARADLERRREERKDLGSRVDQALAGLGTPDAPPSTFALAPGEIEEIANAAGKCSIAGPSAREKGKAVERARAQQGDAPAEPRDLSALKAAHEDWKAVADTTALEMARDNASEILARAAAGLPGSWADLVAAGLPAPETLDEASRDWTTLANDLASARKDLEDREAELAEARADLSAREAAPGAIDIVKTEETRRRRDIEWEKHRGDLTAGTADRFEEAMRADDGARAHYLDGAEARQRLLAARERAGRAGARHETAKSRHDDLVAGRERLSARCSKLAAALGLEADTPPSAFGARQQALTAAAAAAAGHSGAEERLKERLDRRQRALDALAASARPLGHDPARGDLPSRVQDALALEKSVRETWDKWRKGEEGIAALEEEAKQARDEFEAALSELGRLTVALPLRDRSPEGIQAALPRLRVLRECRGEHEKLSDRIGDLERAIGTLEDCAGRVARVLGEHESDAGADPMQVIDRARSRLDSARQADVKRAEAVSRRSELESSKRRLEKERKAASAKLEACFEGQGGEDLEPHDRVTRLAGRDRSRGKKAEAERARRDARQGVDEDLFREEMERMPDATRATELEQALEDAQLARDAARDAWNEVDRLYGEASRADDRGDLATEQATLLEELRGGAREAAVARLGVLSARGALHRLATERRGSMLRDVEEAFVAMTAPAWTGVDVWTQAEGEKLVGIQPDGSKVPAEQMSTGTMGQLYFALRLAGYRSFARAPGPLPMVLDNIMETFDNERARAALQLCAEVGASGQAILFTHHAHLVDLARDCIEGVPVVDMPG